MICTLRKKQNMTSSITSRSGSHLPLRMPPNSQPDSDPAEQPTAIPRKTDEQALPNPELRSGQENLQRFLSVHGKASKASDDGGTSAGISIGADASAESSGVRRRASRIQSGESTNQAGEASEIHQERPRRERTLAFRLYIKSLKTVASALILSTGYRLVRNPGDFARHPMAALEGALNFSERVDEQILQNAQQAVLEKFGNYIPADAPCHRVRAEVSFDMQAVGIPSGVPGTYNRKQNWLMIAPYHVRKGGLHAAVHEYCHCFSHPQFQKALENNPNQLVMDEALTEHIADKIPAYGRFSNTMSKIDSGYDRAKMDNGKRMIHAAQELETTVGEATLMRAYFKGDKAAIRKVSRAAVDIFPKKVTFSAWNAIGKVVGKNKKDAQRLAECFLGASLVNEGKLPSHMNGLGYAGEYLPVFNFWQITDKQQKDLKRQAQQVREQIGAKKFDQAFYNFDEKAAEGALKAVSKELLSKWEPVL